MRPIAWGIGILVLLGGAGILLWTFIPVASAGPDPAGLQALAVESCRCERTHAGKAAKEACWKEFRTRIQPWSNGEGVTMCEPSEHSVVLKTGQEIVTAYRGPREALFCTKDEVEIAANVEAEAYRRLEKDPNAPTTEEALEKLTRDFARGDRPQIAIVERGCASG